MADLQIRAACAGFYNGLVTDDLGVGNLPDHDQFLDAVNSFQATVTAALETDSISNEAGLEIAEVNRQAFRSGRGISLMLQSSDPHEVREARTATRSVLEMCEPLRSEGDRGLISQLGW